MRMLNDESDTKLDMVSIYLTKKEALQLRGYLNQLIEKPELNHVPFSSEDFKKEMTVCIYDEKDL